MRVTSRGDQRFRKYLGPWSGCCYDDYPNSIQEEQRDLNLK